MYNSNVHFQCTISMYNFNVQFQFTISMYNFNVKTFDPTGITLKIDFITWNWKNLILIFSVEQNVLYCTFEMII